MKNKTQGKYLKINCSEIVLKNHNANRNRF